MLRQAFTDRMKQALKAGDARALSTTRLILAGLKDRDIAARGQGNAESIELYDQGNRADLAQREREEIALIESFLPRQLEESEIEAAVKTLIAETGAAGMKDMGRIMAALRERHAGIIDFGRASAIVRLLLG